MQQLEPRGFLGVALRDREAQAAALKDQTFCGQDRLHVLSWLLRRRGMPAVEQCANGEEKPMAEMVDAPNNHRRLVRTEHQVRGYRIGALQKHSVQLADQR